MLLAIGLFSALYGVAFAAVQTDMKRLLAWSSIENLGIVFAAIGLGVVFHGVGMNSLAALALIAALYHSLNHAFIKSLLFLGTGAVLHSTGERNLGRLGGLIHRMPWVAWLTLVGALAMAGLPPLNGFVSEWLLLQAFLFAHEVPRTFVNMILPVGAALVALSAALAAYVMVKFFGVIFLGQPRELALARAHDAGLLERIGLAWLALGCVLLGLLPTYVIDALRAVVAQFSGASLPSTGAPWWLLVPLAGRQASYSAPVLLIALASSVVVTALIVRRFYHHRVRRAAAWDCGFGRLNARMQDTAEGFGQPIRHIFGALFAVNRELPSAFDSAPRYRVTVSDRIWQWLYVPLGTLVQRTADTFAWVQQGRISTYLTYSFTTLVRPPGAHAMKPIEILTQALELIAALAVAPLFLGWVNQCRAWLQNRRAPSIWLPYRGYPQALPQGRGHRRERLTAFPSGTLHRLWCDGGGCRHHSLDGHTPALDRRGRCHRARRSSRDGARLPVAGRDGHRHGLRHARRTPRDDGRISRRARPADGDFRRLDHLRDHGPSGASPRISPRRRSALYPSLAFTGVAFTLILLAENARIPIDNPATHLELTMIHEAMVLEYSARHLALMEWAASLKLFNYACIGFALFLPWGISTGSGGSAVARGLHPRAGREAQRDRGGVSRSSRRYRLSCACFARRSFSRLPFLLAVLGLLVHLLLGA